MSKEIRVSTGSGRCGYCNRMVDNYDDLHLVTSILDGGRGVECVLRGDIEPKDAGPFRRALHRIAPEPETR